MTERELKHDFENTLDTFHHNRIAEIRAIGIPDGNRRVTASGYFDDFAVAAECIYVLDQKKAEGIYFTLNEPHEGLLARRPNRIEYSPQRTTSDRDIVKLRWALVDIDCCRPSGISATDAEVNKALSIRNDIVEFLDEWDLSEELIRGFSGNGYHLLTPIDEDTVHDLAPAIQMLNREFGTEDVTIDVSVTKRAQLTKLYGTHSRKGYEYAGRIHRRSYLEN